MVQTTLTVDGMFCGGCASVLERSVCKLEGVHSANVSFISDAACVRFNESQVSLDKIVATIDSLGYQASVAGSEAPHSDTNIFRRKYQYRLAVAVAFGMWSMLATLATYFGQLPSESMRWWVACISGLLALPVLLYSASEFFRIGWRSIVSRAPGMESLISIAIIAATVVSVINLATGNTVVYFDVPVMLVTFQLIARLTEHSVRRRASDTVRTLLELVPETARKLDGKNYISVTPASLDIGDHIEIRPGERIPIDGTVISGESMINRSLLTGESMPELVEVDGSISAGTLCLDGVLIVSVGALSGKRQVDRLASSVNQQLLSKGQLMRMADNAAFWLLPVIVIAALFSLVIALLQAVGGQEALVRSLAVLVVTCPCALSLAIPLVISVISGSFAKIGILFRDPSALEGAGNINTIVFDKTGTLTTGEPAVKQAHCVRPWSVKEVVSLAAMITEASNHPLARAINQYWLEYSNQEAALDSLQWASRRELTGKGILAKAQDGTECIVGSTRWMQENNIVIPESFARPAGSRVYVAKKGLLVGAIDCVDTLRPETVDVLDSLRKNKYYLVLASGDHADAVANSVGFLGLQSYSGLTPVEKLELVQRFQSDGNGVVFVGDGLNDAPALAAANVGIAMTNASDLARAAADIALLNGGLWKVKTVLSSIQRANVIIKHNLILAVIYNAILLPVAMFGFIAPIGAAVAMALSSISVTLNSLRLAVPQRVRSTKQL